MEQPTNDELLFPQFYAAVKALRECCGEDGYEKPPIARSEVYNETWMLRLTLALLHDYKGEFNIDGNKKTIIADIQKAVRKRWISEGGLHPAFKNEGPTWADAVIGDIDLGTEMKREIIVDTTDEKLTGIMVIEAKIGSKLSEGITQDENYNQAARNIACLAKLVLDQEQDKKQVPIGKCRFVVFGPKEKIKSWKGIERACGIINEAKGVVSEQDRDINVKDKAYAKLTKECLVDAVKTISDQSTAIAWEDIIKATKCPVLDCFYKQVLKEV